MRYFIGSLWRTNGDRNWYKVVGTQFKTDSHYDGGLPGVSFKVKKNKYWSRDSMFWPCVSYDQFASDMIKNFRYPANHPEMRTKPEAR
jgi:hypothetical protein